MRLRPENLTVFAAATDFTKCSWLVNSCKHFGVEPMIAMYEADPAGHFPTCARKIVAFSRAAGEVRTDWVLYLDAYDTFLLKPLEMICEIVNGSPRLSGKTMIVNGELNCWPPEFAERYASSHDRYCYLNAGGCLALKSELLKWHADLLTRDRDQYGWQELYLQDTRRVHVDSQCELFQCGHLAGGDLRLCGDLIYNQATDTFPAVFHSNGRTDHSAIISELPWAKLGGNPRVITVLSTREG